MAQLAPKTLDWVDSAPIRIVAEAESAASPQQVFAILADHLRWPEWFPGVKKVIVTGAAEGVGAQRRVVIPGGTVDEEFIAWEPGERWSFTGVDARPGFTRSLVEDCRLRALGGGGTAISYGMYLDPSSLWRPMTKALARLIRSNNRKAMKNLAQRGALT